MEVYTHTFGFYMLLWESLCSVEGVYPGWSFADLKLKVRLIFGIFQNTGILREIYADSEVSALVTVLGQRRHMLEKMVAPYINSTWSPSKRLLVASRHYKCLHDVLPLPKLQSERTISVAEVGDSTSELRLVFEKATWFRHEGELVFSLFESERRLYSLAFTLNQYNGQRQVYVGAVQGIASNDALEVYRRLTHECHGLRPRDLLISAFRMWCELSGVVNIFAVDDESRAHQSAYFSGHKGVARDYNAMWEELGGKRTGDGFWEIDPVLQRRPADEIPSRKRALYRRRYDLLESMRKGMGVSLAAMTAPNA